MDETAETSGAPPAPDRDGPPRGWFGADLRQVIAALDRREDLLARIAAGRGAGPARDEAGQGSGGAATPAPAGPSPRVPDHAIVSVGRRGARRPSGEVLPYRPRVATLAALLVLGLAGLAWQHWPARPPLVVPISLDARVVVT